MDIKKQVVMLPTDKKASIINFLDNNKLIYIGNQTFDSNIPFVFCHLYILSDEESKEDDWCYGMDGIFQYKGKVSIPDIELPKKIIATTDNSLSVVKEKAGENVWTQQIPQIPQSFIEHYVSENIITQVMVEYERVFKHNEFMEREFFDVLKINPKDNTINIKPIKDTYTRDEVETLLKEISQSISNKHRFGDGIFDVGKWIEENL